MIETTVWADVAELMDTMREWDRLEIAAGGGDVVSSLTHGYHFSKELWTARDTKGRLICIYGVAPVGSVGVVWMLGTDRVEKNAMFVHREAKKFIAHCLEEYSSLQNRVWIENQPSIRWLERLGAQFEPYDDLFVRFEITNNV